jgi:hypothetical protein
VVVRGKGDVEFISGDGCIANGVVPGSQAGGALLIIVSLVGGDGCITWGEKHSGGHDVGGHDADIHLEPAGCATFAAADPQVGTH